MRLSPNSFQTLRIMFPDPIDYYSKLSLLALEDELISESDIKQFSAKVLKLKLPAMMAIRALEVIVKSRLAKKGEANYWNERNNKANDRDNIINKIV